MQRWGFALVSLAISVFTSSVSERPTLDVKDQNSELQGTNSLALRTSRSSPLDLELSGSLAGVPSGEHRFLTREDLLGLPLVSYTVSDDANFTKPTQIRGVLLGELSERISAKPQTDMVIALCRDSYQANYSRAYMARHNPVLVLLIDGKAPADWPKDSEGHHAYMGPYMISHSQFTPSFKVLLNPEEAQIPWGVVRLEFRDEQRAFSTIAPSGPRADSPEVQAGYRIAKQHCIRCHNRGPEGGQKAGRSWEVLSTWAVASPQYFAAYVRNPQSKNPRAQMPGNPNYDDGTIEALILYFQTFSAREKP